MGAGRLPPPVVLQPAGKPAHSGTRRAPPGRLLARTESAWELDSLHARDGGAPFSEATDVDDQTILHHESLTRIVCGSDPPRSRPAGSSIGLGIDCVLLLGRIGPIATSRDGWRRS